MNRDIIIIHGVVLILVGVLSAVLSQQVDEGNYIVPRATLDLGRRNKTAGGQKRKCRSNADCEGLERSQCCETLSGFSKCRKRCKPHKASSPYRTRRGRKKYGTGNSREITNYKVCILGGNTYKDMEKIEAKDSCNKCVCSKGEIICTKKMCLPATCSYKGNQYDEGYHLVLPNGCKRCTCQQNVWQCTSHPCTDMKFQGSNSVMSVVPSIPLAVLASSIYIFWFR